MKRRVTGLAAAACLAVLSAFIAVIGVDNAYAATTQQTFRHLLQLVGQHATRR